MTGPVRIIVEDRQALAFIDESAKQARYAAVLTLNRCAEEFQAVQLGHVERAFTLRSAVSKRFILNNAAKIERANRATKEKLSVFISGANPKIDYLGKFEAGGEKRASSPSRPVAIPTDDLRGTMASIVPRSMFPSALGLVPIKDPTGRSFYSLGRGSVKKKKTPIHTTKRGAIQVKGKKRTFELNPWQNRGLKPEAWGVYQRFGKRRDDIRMIWAYRTKVRIPPILLFMDHARQVLLTRWPVNFPEFFRMAMATARPSAQRVHYYSGQRLSG